MTGKLLWVAALVLWVAACSAGAPETPKSAREEHEVKLLFELEGCKLYEFKDTLGYRHVFATCPGSTVSKQPVSCGKGYWRPSDEVQTTKTPPTVPTLTNPWKRAP